MITKLENFSLKSFNNFSTSENFFNKKNIMFGYNGRGKSSLAKGLYNESIQIFKEENVRFFNREYIKEELLFENSDTNIKGIRAVFSKTEVDRFTELKELSESIKDTKEMITEIKNESKNLRSAIDKIYYEKKVNLDIKKKRNKYLEYQFLSGWEILDTKDTIQLYQEDYKKAKEIEDDKKKLLGYSGDNKDEVELQRVNSNVVPKFNIMALTEKDLIDIKEILIKKFDDVEIPSTEVLSWLEEGEKLHDKDDKRCKFCLNSDSFSIQEISKRIISYKENEKVKNRKIIEKAYNNIYSNRLEIINNIKNKQYLPYLDEYIEKNQELFKDNKDMDDFLEILKNKIDDFDLSISLEDKLFYNILKLLKDYEEFDNNIDIIKKDKVKELTSRINKQDILVKGAIGAKIISDPLIMNKQNEIDVKISKLQDIIKNNEEIKNKIKKIEEKESNLSDFMTFMNEVFTSLLLPFELYLDNEKNAYYLVSKESISKGSNESTILTINDISEGEKNLIALLFFYFELYSDNQQKESKETIELVILDDPISSLDDNNKFYIKEMIKNIINSNFDQVFVMTHSWNDFCDITYGYEADNSTTLFEVYKDTNMNSQISVLGKKIRPYNKLFMEIYEIYKKICDGKFVLSDCEEYHTANSMRRVFEEFLTFKMCKSIIPTKKEIKQITNIYKVANGDELPKNFDIELGSFLTFINVLSHRPIKSDEIKKNVKFLIKYIKTVDKVHFDAIKAL